MPDKLCKECTEKAYLAYNFKVTIEQNDSTLRSVLFKDQIDGMKKDAVFDESNTYLGLGIKTEIAFVDADPFIDDDGDFDYINTTPDNSNPAEHLENNNSYQQDDNEEILQVEGNNEGGEGEEGEDDDEEGSDEELEDIEEENDDEEEIEEGLDENFEIATSKENKIRKKLPASESVDYVKDEDGKFICQICNKKLADKKGLNLHLRLHTGKDLKRCNICNRGKKFNGLKVIKIIN